MEHYQSERISGNSVEFWVESRMEHRQNHLENQSQNNLMVFVNPFVHFSWVTEVLSCLQGCLQNFTSLAIPQ